MAQPRDQLSAFDDAGGNFDPAPTRAKEEDVSVPKSRLDEEIQRRKAAEYGREEAIRKMLDGYKPSAHEQEPEQIKPDDHYQLDGLPEDTDPEVANLLSRVLSTERQKMERDIARQYGPALEKVQRESSIEEIDGVVPGFKKELMADVEQMFRAMSPEQQREYDNRVGIEALAARARLKRMEGGIQGDATDMAFTSPPSVDRADTKKGVTANDIWALSDEEFDALSDRIRFKGGG